MNITEVFQIFNIKFHLVKKHVKHCFCNKQFTALMVLELSLNQKLSLEEDVRKYMQNC